MFTGLITATTRVKESERLEHGLEMTFATPSGWDDLAIGESIATNGVCLTVAAIGQDDYSVFLMTETLSKTSFGSQVPDVVNLERSLQLGQRLGGHIVQGHVDCVGRVKKVGQDEGYTLEIEFPEEHSNLVIPKGSIAIDGVSLTVAECAKNRLTVALIPHTLEYTTLGSLKEHDPVNLEFDMLGKYVVNLIENHHAKR